MKHIPVMLDESIKHLDIDGSGIYVDCTLGRAGHSKAILSKLNEEGKLICFDQDLAALESAREIFKDDSRVTMIHSNFRNLEFELDQIGINKVNGIFLDIGVSSPQLDNPNRGFSYQNEGYLDMRMDQTQSLTAHEVVNNFSRDDLAKYIYLYGEERKANRIASNIVKAREEKKIETTLELAEIVKRAFSAKERVDGHPARRTFQAIRILVNQELQSLEEVLPQATKILEKNGRLVIITFHSLEDRIVKNFLKSMTGECTCPPDFPICVCDSKEILKIPSKQPYLPSKVEIEQNPRSRSAKLRVGIKN
jgi:16S rRNA (cytosine1402-N4)-methyltransferase